jgi:hypothetical protein
LFASGAIGQYSSMKPRSALLCGLAALAFAGCAGQRPAEGLSGKWGRTFTVDERDHHAQVDEVWQFNGVSAATSRATWSGFAHGAPYKTVVDQGWGMRYRGRGLFELEEKGRRLEGPPLAELEDSYEMELDGSEVQVDGGPSEVPLHRLYETIVPAPKPTPPPAPAPVKHSAPQKKKKR